MAFAALVHSQDPTALDFSSLTPDDPLKNLTIAFDAAEKLGVPPLIDPEDVLVGSAPDRFCILTYLSQYVPFCDQLQKRKCKLILY